MVLKISCQTHVLPITCPNLGHVDARGDKSLPLVPVTKRGDKSLRVCVHNLVPVTCPTNSNWFELKRQVPATCPQNPSWEQITDFAQTWHTFWVWWVKDYGKNSESKYFIPFKFGATPAKIAIWHLFMHIY